MDFYISGEIKNKITEEKYPKSSSELNIYSDYQYLSDSILKKLNIKSSKTSQVLFALQDQGLNLDDLYIMLFWPGHLRKPTNQPNSPAVTNTQVKRRWVQPILKELRGDFSFAEIAHLFQIKSIATYHHWESGRREIPFVFFLMAIEKFQGRLQAFIDSLPFEIDLSACKFLNLKPKLYQHFFATPWTPTVMLALRLPALLKMNSIPKQMEYLSQNLKISLPQIEESITQLLHLKLVKIEDSRLQSQPQQLYAIPAITEEKINELRNYWFTETKSLLQNPGLHRFEQHATTHESKEKIMGWIIELREKIRKEVKASDKPETLIHITWQVAEVL